MEIISALTSKMAQGKTTLWIVGRHSLYIRWMRSRQGKLYYSGNSSSKKWQPAQWRICWESSRSAGVCRNWSKLWWEINQPEPPKEPITEWLIFSKSWPVKLPNFLLSLVTQGDGRKLASVALSSSVAVPLLLKPFLPFSLSELQQRTPWHLRTFLISLSLATQSLQLPEEQPFPLICPRSICPPPWLRCFSCVF